MARLAHTCANQELFSTERHLAGRGFGTLSYDVEGCLVVDEEGERERAWRSHHIAAQAPGSIEGEDPWLLIKGNNKRDPDLDTVDKNPAWCSKSQALLRVHPQSHRVTPIFPDLVGWPVACAHFFCVRSEWSDLICFVDFKCKSSAPQSAQLNHPSLVFSWPRTPSVA